MYMCMRLYINARGGEAEEGGGRQGSGRGARVGMRAALGGVAEAVPTPERAAVPLTKRGKANINVVYICVYIYLYR